jgi:hypothetical protein
MPIAILSQGSVWCMRKSKFIHPPGRVFDTENFVLSAQRKAAVGSTVSDDVLHVYRGGSWAAKAASGWC